MNIGYVIKRRNKEGKNILTKNGKFVGAFNSKMDAAKYIRSVYSKEMLRKAGLD